MNTNGIVFQYTKKLDLNWINDCNDSTICQPCPFIMVVVKNLTEQSPEVPKPNIVLECHYNQTRHIPLLIKLWSPSTHCLFACYASILEKLVLLYMQFTNSLVHRILCCVHQNTQIRSINKMPRLMGIWWYLTYFMIVCVRTINEINIAFYFIYNAR